ncbi:MAG: hypothetical protein LBF51_05675, partial [Zoogloeaceae bacterium]|nr:hypothetical protein [Zoogloeaceae bacterium]
RQRKRDGPGNRRFAEKTAGNGFPGLPAEFLVHENAPEKRLGRIMHELFDKFMTETLNKQPNAMRQGWNGFVAV